MQKRRQTGHWGLLALIWLITGSSLLVILGDGNGILGSRPRLLTAVFAADHRIEDPATAFEEARRIFVEQRYRAALESFTALREQYPEFQAREIESWRLASALRWEAEKPGQVQRQLLVQEARLFALRTEGGGFDESAARVVTELTRFQHHGSDPQLFENAARYWEERAIDDEGAVKSYLELMEAAVHPRRGYSIEPDAGLFRMWQNLVRAGASREAMLVLGERLLEGHGFRPYGHHARLVGQPLPAPITWKSRIATDLLGMGPEPSLAAQCHLALAFEAEYRGEFEEALRQARRSRELGEGKSSAARLALELIERVAAPEITLRGNELFRPGSDHRLVLNWRNLRGWSFEIRRLDAVDDLQPMKAVLTGDTSSLARFYREDGGKRLRLDDHRDLDEISAREKGSGAHDPRDSVLVLDPLPEGLYLLVARGKSFDPPTDAIQPEEAFATVVAHHLLQVTQLGLLVMPLPDGQLEFWLHRADTGQPQGGTELMVWHWGTQHGRPTRMTELRVVLDGEGRARVPARFEGGRQFFVSGQSLRGPVLFSSSIYSPRGKRDPRLDWRGLVLSDRPLYRPGELVNLQVFARRQIVPMRELEVPEDLQVELIITAPDGNEFARESHVLDENGALEAQFFLPERPALGAYQVQFEIDGYRVIHGSFQVDEYRLPEFRVDLALDTERNYVTGDTLHVDVDAEYLFGGAVEGVAELVVSRRIHHWYWYPPLPYGWTRSESGPRWPGYYNPSEELLRTRLWLDETGHASLAIPSQITPGQEHLRYEYIVEARVIDASRREETGRVNVRVGPQEYYAALAPLRHVVLPKDEAQVRLHVEDLMQRPGVIEGRWTLRILDGKGVERILLEESVTTDDDGDAVLSFVPRKPGHYRVRYEARDSRGQVLRAETVLWCADPKGNTLVQGGTGLQLIAAEDAFIGDTARVLLVSERPNQWVHLTHSFADELRTEVFRMRGTTRLLEIPLDAAQRPRFHLRVMGAWEYRVHESSVEVQTPNPERFLELEIEFAQDEYRPGELARLHLRAKDARGVAARVPFTLAVVDEAVLQLMPRQLPDLQPYFQDFPVMSPPALQIAAYRFGGYVDYEHDAEAPVETEVDEWLGHSSAEKRARREGFDRDGIVALEESPMASKAGRADFADALLPSSANSPSPSGGAGGLDAPVKLRTDFRTTALWRTAVWTDENGEAEIEFRLPESLTTWNAFGLALDGEGRVGSGEGGTRTRQALMVRLAHPRIFREGDRFRFTATVHNESASEIPARLHLEAEGLEFDAATDTIVVPAFGQSSVEWSARIPAGAAGAAVRRDEKTGRIVVEPRAVKLTIEARGRSESDAFVREVEIHPWGTPMRLVSSAELRGGMGELQLELPGNRRDDLSLASLNFSPSVLSACVDALPYLAEFPYGCTEQTLSRFVPAVAVRAVALKMGVSSARLDPELDEKIARGLRRIGRMQHADGGWGWWTEDETRSYMTAYALTALSEARRYGAEVDARMLERGRERLRALLVDLEQRPDDLAYALHALASCDLALRAELGEDETMQRLSEKLVRDRDELSDYSRALLASYLYEAKRGDEGRKVLAKLQDSVEWDDKYDTAHWGKRWGYYRRAQGAVESTAFALRAYLQLDPGHPHARGAARWLVANRDGMRWDSTRSTAHAIYALCEFAEGQGELDPDYSLIARVGGEEILRLRVTRQNLLDAGGSWPVEVASLVEAGARVELELQGRGSAYTSLSFDTWTADEDPSPSEHWLSVEREYLRLVPVRTLGGQVLLREELLSTGDVVQSGDRIKVRLKLRAHRDLEYLEIHDPRPAGCEPVDRLSGWTHSGSLHGRREVRDEENAWFISVIREGEHQLEYELYAETPGVFRSPPARAGGMYLPDVSGSSRAFRLELSAP